MASVTLADPVNALSTLPPPLGRLVDLVERKPESFVQGDEGIREAGLAAAKFIFDIALSSERNAFPSIDALIRSVSAPEARPPITTRSSAKRKRDDLEGRNVRSSITDPTPLSELFVDGMDDDQIWEQLELRTKRVCRLAETILETGETLGVDEEDGILASDAFDMNASDEDMDEDEDEDEDEEETDEEDDSEDLDEDGSQYGDEAIEDLHEPDDDDYDGEEIDHPSRGANNQSRRRHGHPTLDDDFFSIDDFNRETEAMEAKSRSVGRLADDDNDDDDDDDDDIEQDVDLFEGVQEDLEADDNPSYNDFFAPPAGGRSVPRSKGQTVEEIAASGRRGVRFSESVRIKTIKPKNKMSLGFDLDQYPFTLDDPDGDIGTEELESESEDENGGDEDDGEGFGDSAGLASEEDDDDFEETEQRVQRVKDDLFGDDETIDNSNLSRHQKRMAAISSQISTLEAENVADKDWTLMGEASARSRPVNSLLEEDLEFEHMAKQVPVVTEESTKGLEDRIKQRILDNNFNDVVRKRAMDDKPFLPSKVLELQDTRSQKSLAQIYEDEYTSSRTGNVSIVDDRDGKLKAEHDALEKAWEEVSYKLDALSNAHFTPKPPQAIISTISNLPVVSIESALPTAVSTATMMAPEEIFSASATELRARSEMTPADKKAVRRKEKNSYKKEKERIGTAVEAFGRKGRKGAKKEKEEALKQVVKVGRGVTVVGKKGRERDVKATSAVKLKL